MTSAEAKDTLREKHLGMIKAIIARMAGNSFEVRKWSVGNCVGGFRVQPGQVGLAAVNACRGSSDRVLVSGRFLFISGAQVSRLAWSGYGKLPCPGSKRILIFSIPIMTGRPTHFRRRTQIRFPVRSRSSGSRFATAWCNFTGLRSCFRLIAAAYLYK